MADKEIGNLTPATTPLAGDEIIHGVQSSNSRKLTVDEVRAMKVGSDLGDSDIDGSNILTTGTGRYFDITGTQQIDGIATVSVGSIVKLHFDTVRTLTHSATDLVLPGGVDITTAAGDEIEFIEYATDDWRCLNYQRASTGYIKLSDTRTSGSASGGFTNGAWRIRVLNTEDENDGGFCTLSSNQFTLVSGTYEIEASAAGYHIGQHKVKIRNVSDSADVLIGLNNYSNTGGTGSGTLAVVSGKFTIAASKTFELQHRCATTKATNGSGLDAGFGVSEVYAVVVLKKVS